MVATRFSSSIILSKAAPDWLSTSPSSCDRHPCSWLSSIDSLDGKPRPLPGFEPAAKNIDFAEPTSLQFSRHTGARFLSASSAVGHHGAFPRKPLRGFLQMLQRHMDRIGDLLGIPRQGGGAACIHEKQLLPSFSGLVQSNAEYRNLDIFRHRYRPLPAVRPLRDLAARTAVTSRVMNGTVLLVGFLDRHIYAQQTMRKQAQPFGIVADLGLAVNSYAQAALQIHEEHSDMRVFEDVAQAAECSVTHVVRKDDRSRVQHLDRGNRFPLATVAAVTFSGPIAGGNEEEIQRLDEPDDILDKLDDTGMSGVPNRLLRTSSPGKPLPVSSSELIATLLSSRLSCELPETSCDRFACLEFFTGCFSPSVSVSLKTTESRNLRGSPELHPFRPC